MSPHPAEVSTYTVCQLSACPVGGSTQRSAKRGLSVLSGQDTAVRDLANPVRCPLVRALLCNVRNDCRSTLLHPSICYLRALTIPVQIP